VLPACRERALELSELLSRSARAAAAAHQFLQVWPQNEINTLFRQLFSSVVV
jgi:hypothetical protein